MDLEGPGLKSVEIPYFLNKMEYASAHLLQRYQKFDQNTGT